MVKTNVLPHEIVFGAFLVLTWARLFSAAGLWAAESLVYAGFIAAAIALVAWTNANPTVWRWRARLLFYAVMMNVLFQHMRQAVPLIHDGKKDALLQGWDVALFGGDVAQRLQAIVSPALTELMSIAYGFFIPYLALALVDYGWRAGRAGKVAYAGIFTAYGLGFISYTFLPALGPYLTHTYDVPLTGFFFTDLMQSIYPNATNYADVFPSLHCAISAVILGCDFAFRRRRFWFCLVPVALLWASTIYLRYHYTVDVLAGAILTMAALAVAYFYARQLPKENGA